MKKIMIFCIGLLSLSSFQALNPSNAKAMYGIMPSYFRCPTCGEVEMGGGCVIDFNNSSGPRRCDDA